MKKFIIGIGATALFTISSLANVPVLVMDSGTDFDHNMLKPVASANQQELNGSMGYDDDGNGYADDIYGWNFAEDTKVLVHKDFEPPRYDDVMKFMELMGKLQMYGKEGLSSSEFNFLVKNYNDKEFSAWVGFTGGWAHGSHVAGIIARNNDAIAMKAISHIPVGQPPAREMVEEVARGLSMSLTTRDGSVKAPTMSQIKAYFQSMGQENAQSAMREANYIGSLAPRVINCSFGTENKNLLQAFHQTMVQQWGFSNPSEQDVQDVVNMFIDNALLPRDKAMFSKVPNALVVIAAGNSSEDLDGIVTSPNDVKIDNKLVVAATEDNKKLADFSCHGETKVHVAVPGVNIYSAYPNGRMGYMSGTSQAAPYAARCATLVLDINPDLTALEVKKILMETVDTKSWLRGKVISSGVINLRRALQAAEYSKTKTSLDVAIAQAKDEIADEVSRSIHKKAPMTKLEKEMYMKFAF